MGKLVSVHPTGIHYYAKPLDDEQVNHVSGDPVNLPENAIGPFKSQQEADASAQMAKIKEYVGYTFTEGICRWDYWAMPRM